MFKKLTSPKFLIFTIVFVNLLGYGILYPILPLYEKLFNVGPFWVAAAIGAYPLAQFFAGPILGVLSDRYGRRPLLLFSLLGTIVSFLFFAFAKNVGILFIGRLIDGISGGNISIAQAYMADITPKEKRTEGMGVIAGALSLGFVVGPVIGGLLGQYGIRPPSLVAAAFALLGFLLAFFFLPETEKEETKKQALKLFVFKEIARALRVEKIGIALLLFFMVQTAWSLHLPIFSLFLDQRFSLGTFSAGFLLAYRGAVSAIVQLFLVGKAVNLLGEKRLLKIAVLVMVFGLLLTGETPSLVVLFLGLTLMELGGDFIGPVSMGMISKWAKPSEQGEILGIVTSLGSLGRMIGPYLGGAVFELWGASLPFFLGAGLMFLGWIALLRSNR